MNGWILMVKDEEEKLVHPGNVENHKRAGWAVKSVEQETLQASNLPENPISADVVEAVEQVRPASEAEEKPKRRSRK